MGTRMAPSYTNLFRRKLEQEFSSPRTRNTHKYLALTVATPNIAQPPFPVAKFFSCTEFALSKLTYINGALI